MPSPTCQVKEGAGAYGSTTSGVDVTPAATITIRLADPNVDQWEIQCITTDDTNSAATIQSGLSIDSLNKTATFTAPAIGAALRFRSRVNGGVGPDGASKPSYSTTFCIYTLINGFRTIASDETTESGSFGWVTSLNDVIRAGIGPFVAGGDLTGFPTNQTVSKVNGTTITTAGGALATGAVLRVTGAATADWGAVNLADTDAVTGVLPKANQGAQDLVGDVTGNTGASVVAKVNGQAQGAAVVISALNIDWTLGTVFTKTLAGGNNTFTFSNQASGMIIRVLLTGAASSVTWPTVKWPGGITPNQTGSGIDLYTFVYDGTSIYGSASQALA